MATLLKFTNKRDEEGQVVFDVIEDIFLEAELEKNVWIRSEKGGEYKEQLHAVSSNQNIRKGSIIKLDNGNQYNIVAIDKSIFGNQNITGEKR